ncbi:uncharacterized protein PV09_09562 [Verruconis gallopava]|uniref:Uncharacterized protein n=1 Tax=Verruconis gallopava TaxID=253628 RepID=A0A0D1ZVZ6_9PEZI|nr:uncharacterized protein PV09_09562 [Verruconis gallopava]KIV98647.1 hypothetical protein PV09_09562 [Verruconis gallopava]
MTIPWPQEMTWPTPIQEHATQLTGYLRNVLLHLDRVKDQPITSGEMRTVIMATIDLVGKVTRTPDMTAVHDKIAMIRADLSQNANGQTQEIQNIKEEVKNLTANVQKGTAASEAATVAANEAAEVGKTVAGMARDIKNNGTRHQTGAPMSYATAAAQGALAAGKYNVQNAYTAPSPAPVQREIIVNIRNAQTIQNLRAMNPPNQLKRGDLSIRTTNNSEMQTLLRTYTYGVLVHGIRTSTINMENFEEVRDTILHENRAFLPTADIKYIGWLTRQPPQKAMSSIVIEFTKPEDANRIIDENLVWQGEMCPAERYERQCRLKQCFQRQKYGHIGTQCKAAKTCGYCAQKHSSWECPTKTNREAARKWVVCHGTHEAWSRECPTRKEEVAKIKAILTTRPKYHPALTAHTMRSTSVDWTEYPSGDQDLRET